MCNDDLWTDYSDTIWVLEERLKDASGLNHEQERELRDLLAHFREMRRQRQIQLASKQEALPPAKVEVLPPLPSDDKRRRRQGFNLGLSARVGPYELDTSVKLTKTRRNEE